MEYGYMFEDSMGMDMVSGLLSGLLTGIPSCLISIAGYIFSALALYAIAKRRGINNPWLSWVPVANVWILGSLSDQYRYVVKGQNKAKRKVLLTLNILQGVLGVVIFCGAIGILVQAIGGVMRSADEMELLGTLAGSILGIAGLALPLAGVSIAYVIVYFMALYDVYTSLDPDNNILFLVLSIIFNVTEPYFLFFNRNKDKGMPPRRAERSRPQESDWQPQEPVKDPWEDTPKDWL